MSNSGGNCHTSTEKEEEEDNRSNNNNNNKTSSNGDGDGDGDGRNDEDVDGDGGGSLLRQTLMNVDECFLYKLPPLATSGGHRAEQWDLANPLHTCGLQVERRNNDLYLLFTTEHHTKLVAVSHLPAGQNVHQAVENVLDSSRYFVTQIQSSLPSSLSYHHPTHPGRGSSGNGNGSGRTGSRSIYIGFGFRERDVAIDLLGNLQQFQQSIQRERRAKNLTVAEIPQLAEGEKIRIQFGGSGGDGGGGDGRRHRNPKNDGGDKSTVNRSNTGGGSDKKKQKLTTHGNGGGGGGGAPLLLKKPPKVETTATGTVNTTFSEDQDPSSTTVEVLQMDRLKIQDDHKSVASADSDMAQATMASASVSEEFFGALGLDGDDVEEEEEWDDFQQA